MHIGEPVWARVDGKVIKLFVLECFKDDLKLSDGTTVFMRKYWEVCKNGDRDINNIKKAN